MGNDTKATLVQLFALVSVAAPFVGYGLTELSGNRAYVILGAGMFLLWTSLGLALFLGTYKRIIAERAAQRNQETVNTTDATDTVDTTDNPSSLDT